VAATENNPLHPLETQKSAVASVYHIKFATGVLTERHIAKRGEVGVLGRLPSSKTIGDHVPKVAGTEIGEHVMAEQSWE